MKRLEKKERAILFNSPMAIAARNGNKTQTRRTLSKNLILSENADRFKFHGLDDEYRALFEDLREGEIPWIEPLQCPYGQPGDILWVREPYYAYGHWEKVEKKNGRIGWRFVEEKEYLPEKYFEYRYNDNPPEVVLTRKDTDSHGWYKRLARFMPKAASRTKLEIVNVRVERLNAITMEDAKAEGIMYLGKDAFGEEYYKDYSLSCFERIGARSSFMTLWESINGLDSWNENPFVWVVEFKLLNDASTTLP